MHATQEWTIEEIIKFLPTDPDELIAYKFPPEIQHRLSELIAMSKSGLLTDDARREADHLFALDGKIMMLKVKALKAKKRTK